MADQPISVKFKGKALISEFNAEDFVMDLTMAINRAARTATEDTSRDLADSIVAAFEKQSLPLKKLSEEYQKYKKDNKLDPRKGFKFGTMVKAIKFFKNSDTSFSVGIRKQNAPKKNKSDHITIPKYAQYFEFGTKTQPARPVFGPMLRASRPKYTKAILRNLKSAIRDIISLWEV